ncbi:MAG: NADP-dependent phosphogluconate dehydrogenase [Pseudomonadota bacterium]
MSADIGMIGIGVMGAALALNLAENGFRVAIHDKDFDKMQACADQAAGMKGAISLCETPDTLLASVRSPRAIILLVPAGRAVDAIIDEYRPLLSQGDLLIDAGNANFHDTRRRSAALEGDGFAFLGLGISGGAEGARHGPAIMAGGSPDLWSRVEAPLKAISARHGDTPCCDWFGPDGAGHFVKTIHNGIEYADMQMIAEAYGIMRDGMGHSAPDIAATFGAWNKGPLASFLIEITSQTLTVADEATGLPLIDVIQDRAGQKGTGRWSAIEALHLAAPAPAIEAAVGARGISARKTERQRMEALFGSAPTPIGDALGTDGEARAALESALIAGKIAAYAQGFEVFKAASVQYAWGLDFAAIARVWRAGCIIRSVLLDDIATALAEAPELNLMATPFFADLMRTHQGGLRKVVAVAALHGIAAPALSSALSYFDSYRTSRGTANMIQIQRDFFGHHGFERTDRDGSGHHGPWAGGR